MLRVIGGEFRGRTLLSVPGETTRPPLARVRAAVASIVNDYLTGASILDAFSGTGSYAIELLSRGAKDATCIDKNPRAAQVIKKNVASLGLDSRVTVITGDALQVLPTLDQSGSSFQVILVAPPYFTGLDQKCMDVLGESGLVSPDGILVLQQHRKELYRDSYGSLSALKTYSYGETRVTTYRLSV